MSEKITQIKEFVENSRKEMIALETLLTSIPAISPFNGGDGEYDKVEALTKWLKEHGLTNIERYEDIDEKAKNSVRPSIVVTIPGESDEYSIWFMAHTDVVPPGDLTAWENDPWTVVEKDGKLIGRGVEDNQQGIVSSTFAALALLKNNYKPSHTVKLLFVADEEVGSKHGIQFLIKQNLFKKNDIVIIPDGGDPKGETIEIAEKSILWIKFTTEGFQTHGSTPNRGKNACLATADLMIRINTLENVFNAKDDIFDPPYSTFQPTMHLQNVQSINVIPGNDVSCVDCRVLPCYKLDDVLEKIKEVCNDIEEKYGVKISYECKQKEESPATPSDAPVVKKLSAVLEKVHGIKAKTIGIGGGTVASYLRNVGINAAVWSTIEETCHSPNESCIVNNIIADATTMAVLMLD